MENEDKKLHEKYGYLPVGGIETDDDVTIHTCKFAIDGVRLSDESNYQKGVDILPISAKCHKDLENNKELQKEFDEEMERFWKELGVNRKK